MRETIGSLGKKLLAVLVLALAAYVIFKLVVGLVTAVAWIIVAVVAVIALIWAVRTL